MSQPTLNKLFDVLTPEERSSLSLAALVRGDEVELERLTTAAPRRVVSVLHHKDVMSSLCTCGVLHRAEQLEMIAGYFFAVDRVRHAIEDADCETANWWLDVSSLFAFRYTVNREGWRLFCEELGVGAEDVVDGAPGDWIVDLADSNMPNIAPSVDEMAKLIGALFEQEHTPEDIVSADQLLAAWQALYRGLL